MAQVVPVKAFFQNMGGVLARHHALMIRMAGAMAANWTKDERGVRACDMRRNQGLSCIQIAKRLGGGITSNAVAGHLWRCGVGSSTVRTRGIAPRKAKLKSAVSKPVSGNPAVRALFADPPVVTTIAPDAPSPDGQTILIMRNGRMHANPDFTDSCCRWPIGHPNQPGFHFCGRTKVPLLPYCEQHARIAYDSRVPVRRVPANHIKETV